MCFLFKISGGESKLVRTATDLKNDDAKIRIPGRGAHPRGLQQMMFSLQICVKAETSLHESTDY